MHLTHLPLPLIVLSASSALARWSLTEDFFAFPKYRVTFLNGLPVLNETAERWLHVGIKGGESEFLGHEFHSPGELNAIDSGGSASVSTSCSLSLIVPRTF